MILFFFYLLFLCYFSRLVPLTFAYFVVEIKRVNLSLKIMFEIGHRDTRDCSRGKEVRKKKNNIRNTAVNFQLFRIEFVFLVF